MRFAPVAAALLAAATLAPLAAAPAGIQQEQPVRLSTLLLAFIKEVGGADHTSR